MRLLICTQKVDRDDPILGFFHGWIIEFTKHFDSVIVVCLEEGKHELPANVRVLSLGKEKVKRQKAKGKIASQKSKFEADTFQAPSSQLLASSFSDRLRYAARFISIICRERNNYDAVFVHMNQIYVILGGLLWKAWNKKIGLWYTHRAVHLQLRLAACLSDEIFTAAPESFGLKTKKLHIIGHGIDVESFARGARHAHSGLFPLSDSPGIHSVGNVLHGHDAPLSHSHQNLRLVSIGRITRIKNLETLIEAVGLLRRERTEVHCDIVGSPVTADDDSYFNELKESVKSKGLQDRVHFNHAVPQSEIAAYYLGNDFNINLTPTGGIDKVVLEGMAAGCLPLVSNEAFKAVFGQYADKLIFKFQDPLDLSDKIKALWQTDRTTIAAYLKDKARADFDVRTVVRKLSEVMLG